jgi:hypothetical protein
MIGVGSFGFFAMPAVSTASYMRSIRLAEPRPSVEGHPREEPGPRGAYWR